MKLFYREKGAGTPLLILHGLWGASDNWLPIAGLLADSFRVILPDLRNHGQSPHSDEMNYDLMSDDIIELIQDMNLPVVPHIVGHSMGGKVTMALLMKQPELIKKAVIADIAPISYSSSDGGRHSYIIDFMSSFDLSAHSTRESLTEAIKQNFRSERAQQLFLKNIRKTESGFQWKINYPVLAANFDTISGCPKNLPHAKYTKEILFIKGEKSDLIPDLTTLQQDFPAARLTEIADCGHWMHSEQPEKVAETIRTFLQNK
ncbi:alpha/beta fold hydrolase [Porphyromonadaceae bacterium OttesenSCG-928-L07]|nr:alpha/beta fold hydrolase [Porphyromonadaceae bacterium OttesenSCG-928-L07]